MGKQELSKVSGPHIGGEAKREASVQRGRLIERMAFLDCAMVPYRPLPQSDAAECAGLAQKLTAETATGTAAAAQSPPKEASLSAQRRQLLSEVSHRVEAHRWARNSSGLSMVKGIPYTYSALPEHLVSAASSGATELFNNESSHDFNVELQQQSRRLLTSSSKVKGAAATAAGLGGGPPAPTPASLAKEAAVYTYFWASTLYLVTYTVEAISNKDVNAYAYYLFMNGAGAGQKGRREPCLWLHPGGARGMRGRMILHVDCLYQFCRRCYHFPGILYKLFSKIIPYF